MASLNADSEGVICLYFGPPDECQMCGGWLKAEGGPCEANSRFCSDDCLEDSLEYAARAERERATAWCSSCGYDRHEHAPDCVAPIGSLSGGE